MARSVAAATPSALHKSQSPSATRVVGTSPDSRALSCSRLKAARAGADAISEAEKVAEAAAESAVEAALILAESTPTSPPPKILSPAGRVSTSSTSNAASSSSFASARASFAAREAANARVSASGGGSGTSPHQRVRDVRVGLRGSADEVAAPDASSSPAGTDSSGARTDLDGVLADGMDAVNALPQGGVDMRTPAAMFEAAVERVQAREHTASPDAPSRWRRGLELSKLVETELMETGHNANNLKDTSPPASTSRRATSTARGRQWRSCRRQTWRSSWGSRRLPSSSTSRSSSGVSCRPRSA